MTEAEWMASNDPEPMLEFLRGKVSERKLRLLLSACLRRVSSFLDTKSGLQAVETAERLADGRASRKELQVIRRQLARSLMDRQGWREEDVEFHLDHFEGFHFEDGPSWVCPAAVDIVAARAVGDALSIPRFRQALRTLPDTQPPLPNHLQLRRRLDQDQCDLIRDLYGNPFRTIDAIVWLRWNGGTVAQLAQLAYDERHLPSGELDRGRLAILADSLGDSGCTNADILGHLRGPGPHVRGCFAVDLLLQKS